MKIPTLCAALGLSAHAVMASTVSFDWFSYEGRNPYYQESPPEGHFYNPVLPGFYPDPSITRVGEDYYLVNSSFAWFPGVPLFHSRDLVHWESLGHVLDRPSQLDLDGHRTSRGIFAPVIEHHEGTYYMITTLIDTGGNFLVTTEDPRWDWSDPVWLPEVDGIDPSLFFDDADGRAWVVNNGPPEGEPRYEGHRAIWIQEFDPAEKKTFGPRRVLVDGGVRPEENPIWIEGPHIFKREGWYYLNCAEGGTAEGHRQVILRSRSVDGPYEPWEGNPTLTQSHLDPTRPNPVTSTGHADLVETPEGEWWAVFLATRPYEGNYYNTGRETFLLPVEWTEDGWPSILEGDEPVPLTVPLPAGAPELPEGEVMGSGNFTWRDDFEDDSLQPHWSMLRTPHEQWWQLQGGQLRLEARAVPLTSTAAQPSFLARRQQHAHFTATMQVEVPERKDTEAGLVAFLDERHYFFLGVRGDGGGGAEVFLERADGQVELIAERPLSQLQSVRLRIEGDGRPYTFSWTCGGEPWKNLAELDGSILSIEHSWGFTGAMIGPHVRTVDEAP